MIKVKISNTGDLAALLSADDYQKVVH